MVFSATPSGAWMPTVSAGDTGIPLTQRAQSFLLVPGHPNELAPGKRPRVTLSPTLVTAPDRTVIALSTPGGDNQDQSLLQVLFHVDLLRHERRRSPWRPALPDRHLVSSFDNHAMSPGDLLLDERIAPAVIAELAAPQAHRGHPHALRQRRGSRDDPLLRRPALIEAGADPVLLSGLRKRGRLRSSKIPTRFDRDHLADASARLGRPQYLHRRQLLEVRGLARTRSTRRERYLTRGRFSKKRFEAECLARIRRDLPHRLRRFRLLPVPHPGILGASCSRSAPEHFRFAFKVPEQITCRVFPMHPRYGAQAGRDNEAFLDPHVFQEMFVRPLLPHQRKTALLIFEFGAFGRRTSPTTSANLSTVWILSWPGCRPSSATPWRSAIRTFLEPEYFSCLRAHNVAHVYNAWSKMPELRTQIAIPDSATADFQVCRALLRHGRVYEEAVDAFAPYREVQDPNPEARDSMRVLIGRARENKQFLFLFVNNRLEGNAPSTILSLVE